jgi:HNH endonuclease
MSSETTEVNLSESDEARFWTYIKKADGCWGWTGKPNGAGYGAMRVNGRTTRAHRVSWVIHNGSIPLGIHVLHRCDNPPCCNPDHLWLGTNADNMADKVRKNRQARGPELQKGNVFRKRTSCKWGHAYTPENTWICARGGRVCRECQRGAKRMSARIRRAAAKKKMEAYSK